MATVSVTPQDAKLTRWRGVLAILPAVAAATSSSFGELGKNPSPEMMQSAYNSRHASAGRCRMPRARVPAPVMGRHIVADTVLAAVCRASDESDRRSEDPEGAVAALSDCDGGSWPRNVADPIQK